MATRSLTDIFVIMRNNASQNRNLFSDQSSDRLALVPIEEDIELGKIPPSWSSMVEESQYTMVRLKTKIASLKELYTNMISRPAFDDNTKDEEEIKALTEDIMRMYNNIYKIIGQMDVERLHVKSPLERRLLTSVTQALVTDLQNLQTEFKSMENNYVNMVKSREERSKPYFDFETEPVEEDWGEINLVQAQTWEQRGVEEAEVENILKSFVQLKDLFRDLSRLIVDQGTVLDRIDYNIEVAQTQISLGTEKLAKAAAYQSNNRKMKCILILAAAVILLTVLLIIVKV